MFKRLSCLVVLAVAGSLLASGCGTVLGLSGLQPVNVTIRPDEKDAEVFVNEQKQGSGSGVYKVDTVKNANSIRVRCPDGRSGSANCPREVNAGVVIADAFMLIFPILIDYFDGGLYIVPHDLVVNLGKAPEPSLPPDTTGPTRPPVDRPVEMRDCPVCGEKRPVGSSECPHCGVK